MSQVGSVKHILKEQSVAENCVYQPIMLTDFTSGFKVNSDKSTSAISLMSLFKRLRISKSIHDKEKKQKKQLKWKASTTGETVSTGSVCEPKSVKKKTEFQAQRQEVRTIRFTSASHINNTGPRSQPCGDKCAK